MPNLFLGINNAEQPNWYANMLSLSILNCYCCCWKKSKKMAKMRNLLTEN